jgi:enolase-phosphatase E1
LEAKTIQPRTPSASSPIRALLLDVEGTTTPIDFVFKTLFPFAAAHVESFLREHCQDPEIRQIIVELRQTWSGAAASGAPVWMETSPEEKLSSAAAYVRWLIARDSKITPLKTLQGKVWEAGFRAGQLKGEVYPDVAPAFARWRSQGRRTAIFSSGSVLAQKLLFAHSTAGDLSAFLDAYFDTATGPKREAASYQKIAAAMELEPPDILFVSDVGEELDAAARARMGTTLALRPGTLPPAIATHASIRSFDQLFPNPPAG